MTDIKKIIDLFELYFDYMLTPVYFIICCIIYMIAIILLIISGNPIILYYVGKIFSIFLSFNYIYDQNNINLIDKYIDSNEKFLVVFNHRTAFDVITCLSIFKRNTYLLKTEFPKSIPLSKYVFKYMNLLTVEEKNNTSQKIIDYTNTRKYGQNVLALAPDQCKFPDEIINDGMGEFKTGAFVGMFPIMPIIIKYNDAYLDFKWENGETFIHSLLKVFLYRNYKIKVRVLDMVYPDENSTIDQYKDKVRNIMSIAYNNL